MVVPDCMILIGIVDASCSIIIKALNNDDDGGWVDIEEGS